MVSAFVTSIIVIVALIAALLFVAVYLFRKKTSNQHAKNPINTLDNVLEQKPAFKEEANADLKVEGSVDSEEPQVK